MTDMVVEFSEAIFVEEDDDEYDDYEEYFCDCGYYDEDDEDY